MTAIKETQLANFVKIVLPLFFCIRMCKSSTCKSYDARTHTQPLQKSFLSFESKVCYFIYRGTRDHQGLAPHQPHSSKLSCFYICTDL
jgi:hypothetical protein